MWKYLRTKMLGNKKAQVSIEIIYSVGVLLLIFIMLSGVTLSRKGVVDDTREFIEKRDTCLKISNKLNGILTLEEGFETNFKTIYEVEITDSGMIIVGDEGGENPKEVEAYCSFPGGLVGDVGVVKDAGKYKAYKINGEINITKE